MESSNESDTTCGIIYRGSAHGKGARTSGHTCDLYRVSVVRIGIVFFRVSEKATELERGKKRNCGDDFEVDFV